MAKKISKKSNGSASQPAKGRRFTAEQKEAACLLVENGALPRTSIAALMGTTPESLRRWVVAAANNSEAAETEERAGEEAAVARAAAVAASSAPQASSSSSPPVSESAKGNGKASSIYTPRDPGQGLGKHEVAAILEVKKKSA